ncbi:MAG: hypothetical protein QM790_16455 [Nibricoccus sp.]
MNSLIYRFSILALALSLLCAAPVSAQQEKSLTIDYENVEFRVALRDIADRCELNLVIPESLQGRTSLKLRDVTWKQAFQVMLQPIGYTYVEDGQIVKVLPLEDLADAKAGTTIVRREKEKGGLLDGIWVFPGAAILFGALVVVCHVFLFVGILRDRTIGTPQFAPKVVWAFLALVGGVVPVAAYWLIHHSKLAQQKIRPNQALLPTSMAVTPAASHLSRQP